MMVVYLFQRCVAWEWRSQTFKGVVALSVVSHDQGPPPVGTVISITSMQDIAVKKQCIS